MPHAELQYLDLLHRLLMEEPRPDRTGTGTRSTFSERMSFELDKGFPLLTTKKLPFKVIVHELLWFLRGETNVRSLQAAGVKIWDEWADENGDLGPVYGHQWRSWPHEGGTVDQIANLIEGLRDDPYSRRHLVSAWNPGDVPKMKLPPCHCLFQFYVESDGRLSCQLYQRSADVFLGVPFNIASYALLTEIVAGMVGRQAGNFHWVGGDVHLYENHVNQAQMQITRVPQPLPTVLVDHTDKDDPAEFSVDDFELWNYYPHSHIPGAVSV